MHITLQNVISLISAVAALLAAYHAIRANGKATTINANVNGNVQALLKILQEASVTIPHATAARVVAAPPTIIAADATLEERVAMEFWNKVRNG